MISGLALAQTTGSIEGVVLGPHIGGLRSADVKVIENATAAERIVTTDAEGRFSVTGLGPGSSLKVAVSGFKTSEGHGQITSTSTPSRQIQLAMRWAF